jgi:hypothetical protein
MKSLAGRIASLEARAAEEQAEPVVAIWLDTGKGDFVQRGYFGKPEPCPDVAAVPAEVAGLGFRPKVYRGIDSDWREKMDAGVDGAAGAEADCRGGAAAAGDGAGGVPEAYCEPSATPH